jgi:hypothetical protein
MSRNSKASPVASSSASPQSARSRTRNVPADHDEAILLSDAFEMNPNNDWDRLFHRLSRGQTIRGTCV